MAISTITVRTAKGLDAKVRRWGSGPPVVFFHGSGGLAPVEPMLDLIGAHYCVHAAEWPGFGEELTEGHIEDMLDFALHGWDLVEAMGLAEQYPHLLGHSMGGMIAAEMAAINPRGFNKLVLIAASGLWIDSVPIPDIFAMLPFELADVLFADPKAGEAFLAGGANFADDDALKKFLVTNARRLGTAGKILFPVPNRRLSKRLYRVTNPVLALWGKQDKLIAPIYADRYAEHLTDARVELIDDAGHMLPYEQPGAAASAIIEFLA